MLGNLFDLLRGTARPGKFWMNRGGAIPQREVLASMELFAKEVIPEFRE